MNIPPFFHNYSTLEYHPLHAKDSIFVARKDVPYIQ
jgi:hypothetical protein